MKKLFLSLLIAQLTVKTSVQGQQGVDLVIKNAYILDGTGSKAYKGMIAVKSSSAQITSLYTFKELVGRQVIAVVNLPPRKIADFLSECLILGVYGENNAVILLEPERKVKNGSKVG